MDLPQNEREPLIVPLYAFMPFYMWGPLSVPLYVCVPNSELVPLIMPMPAMERVDYDFEGLPLKLMEPLYVSAEPRMYYDSEDHSLNVMEPLTMPLFASRSWLDELEP